MTGQPNPASALRAKLDQNRATFLKTDLALCSTFVELAATRLKTGNRRSAEQAIVNAEKAHITLSQFLADPKHNRHLTADQIQEFTEKLNRLRAKLDGLQP